MKKTIVYFFALVFIYSCTPQDAPNTFTDSRDGKVYKTVTIGEQVWMAENLAYLPSVVGPATGSNTEPYFYVYGYDGTDVAAAKATANYQTYGVLYNWQAAMNGAVASNTNPSGVQGVCPSGWHLPSLAEVEQLENYLIANGYAYDGSTSDDVAKSLATDSGWNSSDVTGAVGNTDFPEYRNKSGFSGLPGGWRRYLDGIFMQIGNVGYWWTTREYNHDTTCVTCPGLWKDYSVILLIANMSKEDGFSVRCVRD